LKTWVLLISGAVSPYLLHSALPSGFAIPLLLFTAMLALKPAFRLFCLFPVFFLLTTLSINHRLEQRLPASGNGSIHDITGVIGNLPEHRKDYLRFVFLPDRGSANVPGKLRVFWHESKTDSQELPVLHAGERWRLQLELRTTRGRVNFQGVDSERWLFAEGITALAFVQEGNNDRLAGPDRFDLQHWRETVLKELKLLAGEAPAFRLLAALAIADRRDLLKRDRDVLSATGTGHLLAISGLHIGLAAVMGFYLGRLILLFFPYGLGLRTAIAVPWGSAWLAALGYSALSGFGVSTQRALIMLSLATLVFVCRRRVHPSLAWLVAMALVLMVDPLAPLRAGFWFSFVAVAVLLVLFSPRYGELPVWRKMLFAQLGISLIMAPLGMYWFQQVSFPGLVANLVAIPVVSFVIVPLILAGLLFIWLPGPLATWLFHVAGYVAQLLFQLLEQLSALQPVTFATTRIPGLGSTILAMVGALIIMLPRGLPWRYAGILLMLPMIMPVANPVSKTGTQLNMLDVGQGLSVLVGSNDYLLVYDTGPGNGLQGEASWDMVAGTIQPAISAWGRVPDLIVASHADLDHAGGFDQLQSIYPQAEYMASLAKYHPGVLQCRAPGSWSAGDMNFRVLHPSMGLPYLGNDSSCVISVEGKGLSLLLSGDISRVVEQRLAGDLFDKHVILTVPHHGSSTSSSEHLINAVQPELVLISAASNNRFNFPREDVISRYQQAGVRILNTAICGGIRIETKADGSYKVDSARRTRKAIWRWPANQACP